MNPNYFDVFVGTYRSVNDALANYDGLRDLYRQLGASANFDAAVVGKSPDGNVKIEKSSSSTMRISPIR